MAVDITLVVDEEGIVCPRRDPVLCVHGTTTVVTRVTVVTGVLAAPDAALVGLEPDG